MGFGLIGTLLATFFAPKEHIVTHDVSINRPVEACWDATFNPTTITIWRDHLDSVETIEGKYDESGYSAHFVFIDKEQVSKPIYKLDSVQRLALAKSTILLNEKIQLDTRYEFAAIDSMNTRMHITTKLTPKGWLYKVMFSGSGNGLDAKRKTELDNLKKWLENQATNTATNL